MGAGGWSGSSGACAAQAPHAPPAAAPGAASVQRQRGRLSRACPCASLSLPQQVGAPALATIPPTAQPPRRLAAFSARRVVVSASTRPPRGGRESTSRRSTLPCPLPLRLCAFAASETRLSVPRSAGAAPAPLKRSRRTDRHRPTPWTAWRRVRRRRSARRVARRRAAQSRHAATERHDGEQRAGVRLNVRRARSCGDRESARLSALRCWPQATRRWTWTCMHR